MIGAAFSSFLYKLYLGHSLTSEHLRVNGRLTAASFVITLTKFTRMFLYILTKSLHALITPFETSPYHQPKKKLYTK